MPKQRKHIRTSKKGKKFLAGTTSVEQRVTKLLKPMLEKELEGTVVEISIDELEYNDYVSGWAKIGNWKVPGTDESPFAEETDYYFTAKLGKNNKPNNLEFPMEEDVMFGGKMLKCPKCGKTIKENTEGNPRCCQGHSIFGGKIQGQSMQNVKSMLGVDTISKKGDIITVRKEFFYTFGKTAEDFVNRVKEKYPNAEIVDYGETWKPFRGGASTANQSHWYVKFRLI
jgi:uncharacterized C2H2 Zn-finger protein